MSYRILIVEDMPELLDNVCAFFRGEGKDLLEVVSCSDGDEALGKVTNEDFNLMILDVMLPGASGFDICRAARKKGNCPVILLTALGSDENIMKGYELGCDDYVVKPFVMRHLYAKSLALLKRAKREAIGEMLSCGAIKLDKRTLNVTVNGREIYLNSKEYALLFYLLTNKDCILTRQAILDHVWDDNFDVSDRVVDNTIRRLRNALGEASSQVKTVFGRGYKLTEGK